MPGPMHIQLKTAPQPSTFFIAFLNTQINNATPPPLSDSTSSKYWRLLTEPLNQWYNNTNAITPITNNNFYYFLHSAIPTKRC